MRGARESAGGGKAAIARGPHRCGPLIAHPSPLTLLLLLTACGGVSPLRKHAVVGRDSYVVFVADAPDGLGDLFGVRGDGGSVFQITFTPVREAKPALSPDGAMVAFLRARRIQDTLTGTLWVMNLLTGAERRLELPAGIEAEAVGWSRDGRWLIVSAGRFAYELAAPPERGEPRAIRPSEWHRVDSALNVFVGEPPFARVFPCEQALCSQAAGGTPTSIADHATDPARWGPDSLAYLSGGELLVRPAGPGRARRVEWTGIPGNPRGLTAFPGAAALPP